MPIIGFGGSFSTGGGGQSYINGVVNSSADLPITVGDPPIDSVFLAKTGSGVWLLNRKPAGLYCRVANNGNAADWNYLGAFPEVYSDANWEVYNSTDPTKKVELDVSGVTSGNTTTLSVPDKSGTIMLVDDPIKHLVFNNSGTAIQKGKAVYLFGSQGQRTVVRLADNANDTTSARTFGIAAENIADNAEGFVVTEGVLGKVNTNGLSDGQTLWLGSNGNLLTSRPTQPLHGVFMGVVVKGGSVGAGSIFVKVQNGQEIDELHDVLISSPVPSQAIVRNDTNTLWINRVLTPADVSAFPASPQYYSVTLPINGSYNIPSGRYVEVAVSTTYQFGSQSINVQLPAGTAGDVCIVYVSLMPFVTATVGGYTFSNVDPIYGIPNRKFKFIRTTASGWQLDDDFYHEHPFATPLQNGFMSASDKTKLNNLFTTNGWGPMVLNRFRGTLFQDSGYVGGGNWTTGFFSLNPKGNTVEGYDYGAPYPNLFNPVKMLGGGNYVVSAYVRLSGSFNDSVHCQIRRWDGQDNVLSQVSGLEDFGGGAGGSDRIVFATSNPFPSFDRWYTFVPFFAAYNGGNGATIQDVVLTFYRA